MRNVEKRLIEGRWLLPASLAWVVLLAVTCILTALAAGHTTLPGDAGILDWAQDQALPGLAASRLARWMGRTEVDLAVGWAGAVLLLIARQPKTAILLAMGLVILALAQAGSKDLVDRPRPSPPLAELRDGYSSSSFPAGHVMSPVFLYGYALYMALRGMVPPVFSGGVVLFSLFVLAMAGPANVFMGVHWPSDVLGGYAWGAVLLVPILIADILLNSLEKAGR